LRKFGCRKCGGKMDRIKTELLWYDSDADYNFLYGLDGKLTIPRRIITRCRQCKYEIDIVRGNY